MNSNPSDCVSQNTKTNNGLAESPDVEVSNPESFQSSPPSTSNGGFAVQLPRNLSGSTPGAEIISLEASHSAEEHHVSSSSSSGTLDSGLSSISSTSSNAALDSGFRIIDGGWVYIRRYRKAFEDEETFQRNRIMPVGRRNDEFYASIFRLRMSHNSEENAAIRALQRLQLKDEMNHSNHINKNSLPEAEEQIL